MTKTKSESNPWQIATLLLTGLIIGFVLNSFAAKGNLSDSEESGDEGVVETITVEDVAPDKEVELVEIAVSDSEGMGDPDAPVVVVEYSDFQCPYCYRSYTELLPQLKENYIDEGLVYFVYRHYPLSSIHPYAQNDGEATECARDQGAFWEMHDAIFDGQAFTDDDLKGYAADLGLDTNEFDECLDSDKYEEKVKNDLAEGIAAGVSATPTFFINGEKVVGAQPYETISSVIESYL